MKWNPRGNGGDFDVTCHEGNGNGNGHSLSVSRNGNGNGASDGNSHVITSASEGGSIYLNMPRERLVKLLLKMAEAEGSTELARGLRLAATVVEAA